MKLNVSLPSGELKLTIKHSDFDLNDLCGFACRQNPKRGFLFVSKVLGKHYPVKPSIMKKTYDILADKVNLHTIGEDPILFLGFAETATGLSAGIYESWKVMNKSPSLYSHTTRYQFNKNILFRFQEEHSHATGHIVYEPENNFKLNKYKTLVLIDDEMTTGKTSMNFIEQFMELSSCAIEKIVVVCIKNWMSDEAKKKFKEKLNCKVEFVSLLEGNYEFIKDESYVCLPMPNVEATCEDKGLIIDKNFGRFGFEDVPNYNYEPVLNKIKGKKILVLGTGEFSYLPYKLAKYIEDKGFDVYFQSTTRSPILLGEIIKHKLEFIDNYNDNIANFVYNVNKDDYDQILICYETNKIFNFNLDVTLMAENIFFKDLELI
jgi:hypothetical protein